VGKRLIWDADATGHCAPISARHAPMPDAASARAHH
jgi:hypothetical protein